MTATIPATALLQTRKDTLDYLRTGVPQIDGVLDGLPRGAISEATGARSGGKTSLLHTMLARATENLECAAIIDALDSFSPESAQRAGVALDRLLWVRCGGDVERAFKAADLVLHGGGFGFLCLDLAGVSPRLLNRAPLSYWYRFRRAIQDTPAVFLVLSDQPQAKSCASCLLDFEAARPRWRGAPGFRLLQGLEATAAVRKPGAPRSFCFDASSF